MDEYDASHPISKKGKKAARRETVDSGQRDGVRGLHPNTRQSEPGIEYTYMERRRKYRRTTPSRTSLR